MRTAVITVVAGRHEHLRPPAAGTGRGAGPSDDQVVVAIADPAVEPLLAGHRRTDAHRPPADPPGSAAGPGPQRRRGSGACHRRRAAGLPRRRLHPGARLAAAVPAGGNDGAAAAALRARRLPAAAAAARIRPPIGSTPWPTASRAPAPADGVTARQRRPCAVLVAVVRGHRDRLAAARRILRGLRRLRRRGHRLRPDRRSGRLLNPVGGRRDRLPPAPPGQRPAGRTPRDIVSQRRHLPSPLGLVADDRVAHPARERGCRHLSAGHRLVGTRRWVSDESCGGGVFRVVDDEDGLDDMTTSGGEVGEQGGAFGEGYDVGDHVIHYGGSAVS